jgi:hypothetical protein
METFPGLLAGAVHTTVLAEVRCDRATVFMPNLHRKSLLSTKLSPANVMLDPPVAGAYDGMACNSTGSL